MQAKYLPVVKYMTFVIPFIIIISAFKSKVEAFFEVCDYGIDFYCFERYERRHVR